MSAGTTQTLHAWSSLVTVSTTSVPPSVNATTRSHSVVPTSSSSHTRLTSAAPPTLAAMSHARTSSAQRPFQSATTVRILSPFHMTSAAAHTSAAVTATAVLSSAIAHAHMVTSELSQTTWRHAAQLPDASHATPQHQASRLHHMFMFIPLQASQSIPLLPPLHQSRHFHQLSATQFASTTRVRPSTTVIAGHQRTAHTASATLTVLSSARRLSAPQ